jgi:hypothetical protein
LAIVAAWRVLLMIQVVSTVFHISALRAMFPVLLFADSLAVGILFLTPLPVFSIMGGIRLSESEQLIQGTAFLVGALGIVSWPVWAIGTAVVATKRARSQSPVATIPAVREGVSPTLWGLGIVSLAIWIGILPLIQPEQQRRRQVETLLRAGEIKEALEIMSAHDRQDFPPHWDPPPRIGYGETTPELPTVLETLITMETTPWVNDLYWEKYRNLIGRGYDFHNYWGFLNEAEFDRHLTILEHVPKNSPILAEQRERLETFIKAKPTDSSLTEAQKDRLRKLLGVRQDE